MTVTIIIPSIRANPGMLDVALSCVRQTAPDAELIVEDEGGTFAEQVNRGAAKATGQVLIALNDDTQVLDGWLQPLIDPILRDPTVAMTGARLIYPDGTIQHAGIHLYVNEAGVLTAQNIIWDAASGPVQAVTGACLAIRKDLFDQLGGFDTSYRNGYEDVDLCLQVSALGRKIIYVAQSTVIHYESQSGPARWAYAADNIRRLQEKWNPGWDADRNSRSGEAEEASDG